MKTALITLEYPPWHGGISHYYGQLVEHYPEKIIVLSNKDNQLVKGTGPVISWLPSLKRVIRLIKKEKVNYILVGHILPLGTVAWLLSYWLDFRYTVFLHGYDLNCALARPRKKWLAQKILNKADRIICANRYTADLVKPIIDQKQLGKIMAVNPGVGERPAVNVSAVKDLKNKYNLNNKTILFSLGRLIKRKGFDNAIAALPQALAEAPEIIYLIAGAGSDEDYLKQQAKQLESTCRGIENKVIFLGDISEEDKWLWLDACDIFILPARQIGYDFEGFGIVYLEANLANKPVIAGRSGGVADAVKDNLNGLLVDPNNLNDISQAIVKLCHYPGLRQRLGEQGRQRAITEFNWIKLAKKVYDIVNHTGY